MERSHIQNVPGLNSVIQSPLLSFRSVADNLNSPMHQRPASDCVPESQSSWQAPPSIIQDSMPDNDLVYAQYCTPTRLLEYYASKTLSSSPPSSSPLRLGRQGPVLATPSPQRRQPVRDEQSQSQEPTEGADEDAQDFNSLRVDNQRSSPPTLTLPAAMDAPPVFIENHSIRVSPASSHRAESEPPLSKRARLSRDRTPGEPISRSVSDLGSRVRGGNKLPTHYSFPDALEILSPPPTTDQRELRPEDMVTDVLASLARELDLGKRFRPESQTRALRPFERGYWLVDCASWDADLKRSAWGFLADYLGKGAAGWGTSCRRDAAFSWIRLYCWGCVVGHMYLLLYLMSKRRVLCTGTCWIGADGTPVVVMGARKVIS